MYVWCENTSNLDIVWTTAHDSHWRIGRKHGLKKKKYFLIKLIMRQFVIVIVTELSSYSNIWIRNSLQSSTVKTTGANIQQKAYREFCYQPILDRAFEEDGAKIKNSWRCAKYKTSPITQKYMAKKECIAYYSNLRNGHDIFPICTYLNRKLSTLITVKRN